MRCRVEKCLSLCNTYKNFICIMKKPFFSLKLDVVIIVEESLEATNRSWTATPYWNIFFFQQKSVRSVVLALLSALCTQWWSVTLKPHVCGYFTLSQCMFVMFLFRSWQPNVRLDYTLVLRQIRPLQDWGYTDYL